MEQSARLPVTLCMLTRNEEDRLSASLGAVRERVERLVVLDAESDDRTREIAEERGAEVLVRPWEGFVSARRHLISRASTPWIMMIDADEVVGAGLWEELGERGFPECDVAGFQMRRRTVYQGKTLRRAFQPDWKMVLFKADSAYLEDRSVHESVKVSGTVVRLRAEIRHHSYRSADDQYERIRSYARLAARDLWSRGERAGFADLWLRPAWRIFSELVLQGAIIDGRLGIVMAGRAAYGIHLRYRLLRELQAGSGA